ncbi:MAG: SRPBCC domain-containing protein [Solirubrobacterales bacterium]|nr:SRPBCC domain-containing protein [Solirubrobacterales bacterium]
MTDPSTAPAPDRDVRITHVADAPRDIVFHVWTDPEEVARWWGPHGFDVPRESVNIELRPGGRYDMVMKLVDPEIASGMGAEVGVEFSDSAEVVEVKEGELLVIRSEPQPQIGLPEPITTRVEFADSADGRTEITIISGPHTGQMAPNAKAGFAQQLEKLDSLLASR